MNDRLERYLGSLTDEQRQAVCLPTDKSALVHAGAGSGKTMTLVGRIAYLKMNGVPGSRILAVTFTNQAARELTERVARIIGTEDDWRERVRTGTFHAIGLRWLRRNAELVEETIGMPFQKDFGVADQTDMKRMIRAASESLVDAGSGARLSRHDVDVLVGLLDHHAWASADPEQLAVRMEDDSSTGGEEGINSAGQPAARMKTSRGEPVKVSYEIPKSKEQIIVPAADLVRAYVRYKRKHAMVDYSDLIQLTVRTMEANGYERPGYEYVLCDEYQDTNELQDRMLGLLRQAREPGMQPCPIYAVGDEAQILYSWRGADPTNIRGFADRENCTRHQLRRNWRSTQLILDAGNLVILPSKLRHFKPLVAARKERHQAPVEIHSYATAEEEASSIATFMARNIDGGKNPSQHAVLARTARALVMIEARVAGKNIPYRLTAGSKLADRQEVRDVCAWLRVIVNPHDSMAMERVLTRPKRGIGEAALRRIREIADARRCSWIEALPAAAAIGALRETGKRGAKEIEQILSELMTRAESGISPHAMVEAVADLSGIRGRISIEATSEDESERDAAQMRLERLNVLGTMAHEHRTIGTLTDHLAISDMTQERDDRECATLSTVHAAKGREWDCVIVAGFEEGILPVAGSDTKEQLEEERRIAHVAFTRARRRLVITWARKRGNDQEMSRFATDMPDIKRVHHAATR